MNAFPITRHRRLRTSETLRRLVRETRLSVDDLIQPIFLVPGSGIKNEVKSLPGQFQFSVDRVVDYAKELSSLGIQAILLFGIPEHKDAEGSSSWQEDGIIQQAIRAIKNDVPELFVITDLCFCEYTDHGHCGVLKNGVLDNDLTLPLLAKQTISHAKAGADMIAPSGMIDGAVYEMRRALDEAGYQMTPIMSYAAKFASSCYGPFRDAADCAPSEGDRKSYQMDSANSDEALREAKSDLEEGADIIMVKPAMMYLDIIQRIKKETEAPLAAYNVSGEYAMIKAAGANGWIDERAVMEESLLSIKRAGADLIITYFAEQFAKSIT